MSNPIGALLPFSSQPTQLPYLTPAQFTAYPTWLDLDNLVPGGLGSLQTDALADVLLAASLWCDSMMGGMRLGAHLVTNENRQTRVLPDGRIYLHPRDIPVLSVTNLTYGWDALPQFQATLPLTPNPFRNDGNGRWLSFCPGGPQAFAGTPGQSGGWAGYGYGTASPVYVTWSYVAGYASTFLATSCGAAEDGVFVSDPTGIMPGQVLRIFDEGETQQGASEDLYVDPSYVPQLPTFPPTPTLIPLAGSGTQFPHAATTGITGFPRDILQALIAYTVALLMREDVSAEEPSTGFGPDARTTGSGREGGAASGLVNDAMGWLLPYRSVTRAA